MINDIYYEANRNIVLDKIICVNMYKNMMYATKLNNQLLYEIAQYVDNCTGFPYKLQQAIFSKENKIRNMQRAKKAVENKIAKRASCDFLKNRNIIKETVLQIHEIHEKISTAVDGILYKDSMYRKGFVRMSLSSKLIPDAKVLHFKLKRCILKRNLGF
ncbi:hypothetical protein TCON_1575 [Astathelohania contejeani]|uniref:Uncharacterized protein n=1 Tax=Astathelohania contejeani TaxID=164912 RepID=A0ABQ7HYF2_9MICR|nr:hypothetical protein TCON_1575 [Thelohania contejeani]